MVGQFYGPGLAPSAMVTSEGYMNYFWLIFAIIFLGSVGLPLWHRFRERGRESWRIYLAALLTGLAVTILYLYSLSCEIQQRTVGNENARLLRSSWYEPSCNPRNTALLAVVILLSFLVFFWWARRDDRRKSSGAGEA